LDKQDPGRRLVACLSNVTSVSGLSSSWVLFVQCYQCLWIVFVLGLACPMLPDKQDPGRRQSRDTGNIGQTNNKQDEDNPETLVTLEKQDPGRRQSRDIGNIGLLPVSLDCLRPVFCVPNVTSVSGLFSSWVLFVQCYQCLWIVFVLSLVWTKTIQRHW
jgi:hypothetical protein